MFTRAGSLRGLRKHVDVCRGTTTKQCKTYYVGDAVFLEQIDLCHGTNIKQCKTYYVGDAVCLARISLCRGTNIKHCETYYLVGFVPTETRHFIILKGSRLTPRQALPPEF
jgi:hypothetical protein